MMQKAEQPVSPAKRGGDVSAAEGRPKPSARPDQKAQTIGAEAMRSGSFDSGLDDAEARNSTVDRALRVLEAFLVGEPELGVLELSRQLELDKSVIHRILATLVRRRFLEQDPATRRYQVGLRVWELGQRYLAGHQLEDLAEKELTRVIARHPYATAYLATLDGGDVVVLTTLRGPGPINVYIDPGTRMPAEVTATGRALLAHLPEVQMTRLVNKRRQAGLGGRAAIGLKELAKELALVRYQGYSISRGEYAPGIGTVAVAVRGGVGQPVVSLTIDFLVAPETDSLWEELPKELVASVEEIERVVNAPSGKT
jgi:DNA-binding IclR family transcriptional regulator